MITDQRVASIPYQDEWIDEAGEELESYNNEPFLAPFMERWGLDPKGFGSLVARIEAIKRCIRAPDHPLRLDDLADYLDELKNNGKQLIFLWHLKPGEEAYLQELAHLHQERKSLVWETDIETDVSEPAEPAEVASASGVLRFKWVASRRFIVQVKSADSGAPPSFAPRTQRATTFFRVDLSSGDAELRIQSLPPGKGLPSPREEFERYRSEVEKVVDLNRFAPVLIEPVASHWLRTPPRGLVTTTWSVARASGEHLGGGGNHQGFADWLSLIFGNYAAKRVTLRWDCEQRIADQSLFFTLEGFKDEVDFNGRADASRVDFLLDRIRHDELPSFHLRELRILAAKHPEHARILSALDHHFATLQSLRVPVGKVAADIWYDPDAIRRVFALAAAEFPKTFALRGDVLVLRNRLRLREGGLVEAVERFAKDKGHPRVRALAKPVMVAVTPFAFVAYDVLLDWLWSSLFEKLTGVSFDQVEVVLVALVAVLHLLVTFGGASMKKLALRLLGPVRAIFEGLQSLMKGGKALVSSLEVMYRLWLSSRSPAASS
ncbi:MAG: hypothetical protein ACJ76Y_25005 [Thermoanaerobaculia bacterium]